MKVGPKHRRVEVIKSQTSQEAAAFVGVAQQVDVDDDEEKEADMVMVSRRLQTAASADCIVDKEGRAR